MINDVNEALITSTTTTAAAQKISRISQTIPEYDKATTNATIKNNTMHDNCEGGENHLNEDDDFPRTLLTDITDAANANVTTITTHTQMINKPDRDYKMTNSHEVLQESKCLSLVTSLSSPSRLNDSDNDNNYDNSTSVLLTQTKSSNKREHDVSEETIAQKLTAATTTTTATLTVKPSSLSVELQNQATTLRHKNITNVPCKASYQRTLETETSTERPKALVQCELLEYTQTSSQKDLQPANHKLQSLAERKALLKKEFFKDFPTEHRDYNAKTGLSRRLLKKQHNLKLKIPQQQLKAQNVTVEADGNQSLVALRKLDLQRNLKKLPLEVKDSTKDLHARFPSVKELAKRFDYTPKMIVPQTKLNADTEMMSLKPDALDQRHSPLSDEGCNLGQSPYSSDDDNDSIRTTHTAIERIPAKRKDKVARSASSDSALGLEVDESMDTNEHATPPHQQKRRMTLTVTDLPLRPALLPVAEPTLLPDSPVLDAAPGAGFNQTQIPTKVLLEERVVEIPEDPRSGGSSRRESSQSCFSDFPANDMQGVRFVRTPSVVVSDYSDDIMCGITLEEIEYFRAQRMRRRRSSLDTSGTEKDALDNNSDVSASSSCSNLYYCGSTISALDGAECLVNGMRLQLERKISDCSTCSVSGDEDANQQRFTIPEQPEDCQDLSDMLANQHLSCKRSKKVGGITTTGLLTVDHTNYP